MVSFRPGHLGCLERFTSLRLLRTTSSSRLFNQRGRRYSLPLTSLSERTADELDGGVEEEDGENSC